MSIARSWGVNQGITLAHSAGYTCQHSFPDIDAELEQFAVNARCAPQRILATHLANQIPRFLGYRRSSRVAAAQLPGPEQSKPLIVDPGRTFELGSESGLAKHREEVYRSWLFAAQNIW